MTLRNTVLFLVLLTSAFVLGATLFSFQPTQEPEGAEGMMAMPKPGKFHEAMKQATGVWDAKMMMGEMGETTGVETNAMICDGMWMQSKFESTFAGAPFEGMGLVGYDTAKKKYVQVWVDSMSPSLSMGEGEFSKDGKTLTMFMQSTDPATGQPYKSKMMDTYDSKDHRTMVSMAKNDAGEWVESWRIEYTRRK